MTNPTPTPPTGRPSTHTANEVRQALDLSSEQWTRARTAGAIPDPDHGHRWSAATLAALVDRRDSIVTAASDVVDITELATRIGWEPAEVFRAIDASLIPGPDFARYWTTRTADEIAADADQVRALIPAQPIGASRCADLLTELCGRTVFAIDVEDLADHGHLHPAGYFRHRPLFDPNHVRALAASDTGAALIAAHHHLGPDQAAARLGIRRVDFDHLTAKGWLTASAHVDNPIGRTPIALYRTRDLDHLTSHAALDWTALRNTTPGQRSPVPPRPTGGAR